MLQARREGLEQDNGRHEGADARQMQEPRPNRC